MDEFSKYLISSKKKILDALKQLNRFGKADALTLFVVDDNSCMLGTLTDGDIRRRLVEGCGLSEILLNVMHRQFEFLEVDNIQVEKIRDCRERGICLMPVLDRSKQIQNIINFKKNLSYLPIDAVLMAGGKGERLRPLTEHTPKPLLKVGEKAIIDYNVDRLISFGVEQIYVTVNYLKEQIEDHFSSYNKGNIQCICEPKYLGTIGSISFIDGFSKESVLVMNSDLFTNINYEDFYLHFKKHDADMAVAAIPYSVSVPYGIFELNGREVERILEKPTYNYYANAGIYLIKKDLLKLIPNNTFFNATDFIELLVKKNRKVVRFPISGYWIDIGKHEELARAQELAKHIFCYNG